MTLAWHTTTASPLLRYDRNITAPFLEDDSLFILKHFPLSTPVYAYDFLVPTSELQPSPSLELHSRHGSLASLGIWYPNSRPAFHAALEGLSPSQRITIGVITNETTCIRADSADGWVV